MMMVPSSVRIFLWTDPVDMRKGFDGLSGLVLRAGHDLYSGHLYVFLSRRADRLKVLSFDGSGLVLWYKRISKGRFRVPIRRGHEEVVTLDAGQLAMLVDGVDLRRVQRAKRWVPKPAA